jgi:UDP-2,3-diacylglucosamine hydrolase
VKVIKPNQDLRFDVPAVGCDTLAVIAEVKAAARAVEAGKTLIFDRPEALKAAARAKIAVWGI